MPRAVVITEKEAAISAREHIDVLVRPEEKALIETAVRLKGLTLSDFILQTALENARKAIHGHETWTLELPDAELFAA